MAIDLEQFSEDNFQEEFIDFVFAEQTEKNDKAVIEEQEQLKEEYYHENINVKEELGSKEETQIYLRLKNEGFSAPQIRLILPLASLYSEDKILTYFNADMSEDDIKDCVDLLQI